MKRLLIVAMVIPLWAVAADRDMDGVRDDRDRCKNTPFWVIVDAKGCPVKRIKHRKR